MHIEEFLKSVNYNSSYNLILNSFIREYDLSKANINALYERGIISKSKYDELYTSDKQIREKVIGLMIRKDINIYKEIQNGIMDAKRKLLLSNNIEPEDIVSIKNDAVFVKNNKLEYTKFGLMDFKLKNTYTIFIKIDKYEFYYYYNPYNNEEILDIKGLSDDSLKLHKEYFVDFLLALFNTLQVEGIVQAINMIQNFSRSYISKKLDIGYYRNFNSESNYTLTYNTSLFYNSYSSITVDNIELVDIAYNHEIIRNIYGILLSYYFKKIKD